MQVSIRSANHFISLFSLDVIIDDCWHAASRDNTTGAPVADPVRFPNGLKHVADQIHSLGLKASLPGFIIICQFNGVPQAGIYSDAGAFTCAGHFGSLGFEEIDAATYASWGMDYLSACQDYV